MYIIPYDYDYDSASIREKTETILDDYTLRQQVEHETMASETRSKICFWFETDIATRDRHNYYSRTRLGRHGTISEVFTLCVSLEL